MNFLKVPGTQPALRPDTLFDIAGFPISNAFLLTWVIIGIFLLVGYLLASRQSLVPRGLQNFLEIIVDLIRGLIQQITGSKSATATLLPIIGTLLVFIAVSNSIGIIPGLTSITYDGMPLLRTPTNDFNMTLTMALAMSILVHAASVKKIGLFSHLGKFVQVGGVIQGFRAGVGSGFMALVNFLIGLMDIISELAKVVSMSVRLFGNIYAGEVMTVILYGLVAAAIPIPWHAMSLFSGIIQAMVFGMLTTVFYSLMVLDGQGEES